MIGCLVLPIGSSTRSAEIDLHLLQLKISSVVRRRQKSGNGEFGKSAGPGRAPPPQFQPVLSPDCDDVDGDAATDGVQYKVGKIIGHNVKKTADEIYRGQEANQTQKHHKAR
jgi:hypothetical protein